MTTCTGRVALVTGSTSGIGEAIARRFSQMGFTVVLHSRHSRQAGEALAASLPRASYIQADLACEQQARALVPELLARHGRLDVLVNNAAISEVIPHHHLRQATPEVWRRLYEVNVVAPWLLITEAEQALREAAASGRPGCILNISSHAGIRPKGASIPYAVSKAALNHMTRLLALSLGPDIRVNAIAPGLVDTPMTASWHEARLRWQTHAPMRRGARPDDIADLAAMMVASDYLTGEILLVDGGLNLC